MKHQRSLGFLTIEITIALLIAVIVGLFALQQQARSSKSELGRIQADTFRELEQAVNSYASLYRPQIVTGLSVSVNGTTIPGVSKLTPIENVSEGSTRKPTVAQLRGIGILPAGFQALSVLGPAEYLTRLAVPNPSQCNEDTCKLEGYVILSRPLVETNDDIATGEYDGQLVGDFLRFLGGNALAAVTLGDPLVSASGTDQISLTASDANTLSNNGNFTPAGTIGVRVGTFATRAVNSDFLPGQDYCEGSGLIFWPRTQGAVSTPNRVCAYNILPSDGNYMTLFNILEGEGCVGTFTDIQRKLSSPVLDIVPQITGQARLFCQPDPNDDDVVLLRELNSFRSCGSTGGGGGGGSRPPASGSCAVTLNGTTYGTAITSLP